MTNELASQLINISKPGSKLVIESEPDELEFLLKVNGFINLSQENGSITKCEKPTYQLGSSARIDLKKSPAVWKIDDGDDNDEELIDSDELLDENDLKRPDPTSLKGKNYTSHMYFRIQLLLSIISSWIYYLNDYLVLAQTNSQLEHVQHMLPQLCLSYLFCMLKYS